VGKCRAGQAADVNMAYGRSCWIPKATNTHSEYVIFIAISLQPWLHEGASVLRYIRYNACLVKVTK